MNPDTNEEKKIPEETGELKWGSEVIPKKVDQSYLYQDPTVATAPAITESVEEVTPSVSKTVETPIEPSVVEPTVSPIVPPVNHIPNEDMPKSEPQSGDALVPPTQGMANEEVSPESPKKGKGSGILLVLLFVFLLAFVIFLPNITEFINIQKDKAEQGKATPTPTATATPTPTSTPELSIGLDAIAKAFQENQKVVELKALSSDTVLSAVVNQNTLTVTYQVPSKGIDFVNVYTLTEHILATPSSDAVTGPILVDVISQLQGNKEGESELFFQQDSAIYLLAVDGIELKMNEDSTWQIQVDLAKKMNVVDPSTVSIELADLKKFSDTLLLTDTSDYLPKGNLVFLKKPSPVDTYYTIYLGEKSEISENTYRSLLAIVEFYLGQEVTSFQANYPKIVLEEQTIGKVKISIPEEDDTNLDTFHRLGTYQVLRIEITK